MGERGVGGLVRKCVWFTIQTWGGEHSYKAQEGAQWMSRAVCWQFFVSLGDATLVWRVNVHSTFRVPWGMLHEGGGLMCTACSGNLT
jgi:hypothetical protein